MLAYPIPEAETLLISKLEAAKASLGNCEEDLDFLREQITVSPSLFLGSRTLRSTDVKSSADKKQQTMEVATARVYNWDVGQRRKEKGEN